MLPPAACEAGAPPESAGALAPPPVDGAAADALVDGDAPLPEQAETTIAASANGVASRRRECFLVKSVLLWSGGGDGASEDVVPAGAGTGAIRSPPVVIALVVAVDVPALALRQSRAFHCRGGQCVKSVNVSLPACCCFRSGGRVRVRSCAGCSLQPSDAAVT
jgi:hypothetical protein